MQLFKRIFYFLIFIHIIIIVSCSNDVQGTSDEDSSSQRRVRSESSSHNAESSQDSSTDEGDSNTGSVASENISSSLKRVSDDSSLSEGLSSGVSSDDGESESSISVPISSPFVESNNLNPEIEAKVDSILTFMTLPEMAGQMVQPIWVNVAKEWNEIDNLKNLNIGSLIHGSTTLLENSPEAWIDAFTEIQNVMLESRLKIPMLVGIDAVHGNNYLKGSVVFPHNINIAATRDADLAERIGRITAIETAAGGANWTFAPCVSVSRNERWGRVYEALGETAEIAEPLSRALVKGLQGDLTQTNTIGATAKHFIGDGATENGIERGEVKNLSDADLRSMYLPPYTAAIEAGVTSIMAAFNSVNGTRMHMNKSILYDLLKVELGFNGVVVSDWEGFLVEGGTVEGALIAGVDIYMAVGKGDKKYTVILDELIALGEGSAEHAARIEESCRRILRMKYRLNLFENPFPDRALASQVGLAEHKSVAREAVQKSFVVAKNDNGILPLSKSGKIVVVGRHANNLSLQSGGWTRDWQGFQIDGIWSDYDNGEATTIYEGIFDVAAGAEVVYTESDIISDADVAIVVVGEEPYAEWIGDDYRCISSGWIPSDMSCDRAGRDALYISPEQNELVMGYKDAQIPLVVILISGRPMVVTDEIDASDAFAMAFLPGSEGGGVADVLFGDVAPTGKLPYTWPAQYDQIPINDGDGKIGKFTLGHGLSW